MFEILSFCQLLAKIAHGAAFFHAAARPTTPFISQEPDWTLQWEPLLPDLILGRTPDQHAVLVGGIDSVENAPEEMGFPTLFESVYVGDELYLIAELRLFAYEGTPIYRVVVGRRKQPASGRDVPF